MARHDADTGDDKLLADLHRIAVRCRFHLDPTRPGPTTDERGARDPCHTDRRRCPMSSLRLGMVGSSQGNGHPYSWSAICNGYEPDAMASCPFPVIPQYLADQQWPDAQLDGARVEAIWTQDREGAEHIAAASRIAQVCSTLDELVALELDGVVLARDDDSHLRFARPFLERGTPVLFDKPFATDRATAQRLLDLVGTTPVVGLSSLTRDPEFSAPPGPDLGEVLHVHAVTPKSWSAYGAHVVDSVLTVLDLDESPEILARSAPPGGGRFVLAHVPDGPTVSILATGRPGVPISLRLDGAESTEPRVFGTPFVAFRRTLALFADVVRGEAEPTDRARLLASATLLGRGGAAE